MLNREPALYIALVQAVLVLAVAFGVDLTAEQTAAVLAVVVAIGAVATRQTVYSPATVGEVMDAEAVIADAEDL